MAIPVVIASALVAWHMAEPLGFVYVSSREKPEWCQHPSQCGDWPSRRILVSGQSVALEFEDGRYYVSMTSTYDRKTESDFSNEIVIDVVNGDVATWRTR